MSDAPTWTTRDGRKVPVTEMTDAHLQNAIAMLEKMRDPIFFAVLARRLLPRLQRAGGGTSTELRGGLPAMKSKEFIRKVLRPAGAVLVKKDGDHHVYRLQNGRTIAVPVGGTQKEVSTGLLRRYKRLVTSLACLALFACDVPLEELENRARSFEQLSEVKRLSCSRGSNSMTCSGFLERKPIRYQCDVSSCWWVLSEPRCD